jgi:hypothetical protein
MAEVGDRIRWGYEDNEVVLRVGYDHTLERIIDGFGEAEWFEDLLERMYGPFVDGLDVAVQVGALSAEEREEYLANCYAVVDAKIREIFGNVEAELDDYARQY